MSIWEKLGFSGNQAQQQQQQQQVQQVQVVEPQKPAEPDPEPLTKQAEWFKPAETDAKPVELDTTKLFDTDPAKLQEAIGNLNFLQGVLTQEAMTKIEAGGPEATREMLNIVNRSNQQALAAALQASSKMVENAVAKVAPVMDQKVSHRLKEQQVETAIREANPVFQTPAGEFMLNAVKEAMLKKFPNATNQQIKDNAQQFIQDLIKVGGPKDTQQQGNGKDMMETDWAKMFL